MLQSIKTKLSVKDIVVPLWQGRQKVSFGGQCLPLPPSKTPMHVCHKQGLKVLVSVSAEIIIILFVLLFHYI